LESEGIIMSLRAKVLGGYRRLLRASRTTFRGDVYATDQARLALRDQFFSNREVADEAALKELLKGIDEAEAMLLHNIVQARQKDADAATGAPRFEVQLTDPQRSAMRQDEELMPLTEKSASEPLVMNSGNVCQRP
jgi:complex III assembly factor LYRM7